MSTQTESSALDTIKLIAAVMLLVVAIFVFYQLKSMGMVLVVQILGFLGVMFLSGLVFASSAQGSSFLAFFKSSRQELRRVVWPGRQETLQLTLIVVFMVLVFAIFLWGVDKILAAIRFGLIGG
jgi:preprotein translocase subunit SecE